VIVLGQGREHRVELVQVNDIEGNLQVGRVPEALDLEAHDRVGCTILLVEDGLLVRECIKGPGDGEFGCAVVNRRAVEILASG
jgi:hypothetical protein